MITLKIVVILAFCSALAVVLDAFFLSSWSPEMVVLVVTGIVTSISAAIVAVLSALNKGKIDEIKARSEVNEAQARKQLHMSERNNEALQEVHKEIIANTGATHAAKEEVQRSVDQTKVRVEELSRVVGSQTSRILEKGEKGDKGDKGDRGERGKTVNEYR